MQFLIRLDGEFRQLPVSHKSIIRVHGLFEFARQFSRIETGAMHNDGGMKPSIFTFGGDREVFDPNITDNFLRVENDVWRYGPKD